MESTINHAINWNLFRNNQFIDSQFEFLWFHSALNLIMAFSIFGPKELNSSIKSPDGTLPPWCHVKYVTEQLQDILLGDGEQQEIMVHVGTTDLGRKGEEFMKSEFGELGRKLIRRTSDIVTSRLLPVPHA
eukprot:g34276.t1